MVIASEERGVRRAGIPRKRGADGRLYIDVPGVVHGFEGLPSEKAGESRSCPLLRAPKGWLSTSEAALVLGVSTRAVALLLLRNRVRCVWARHRKGMPVRYWASGGVRRVAKSQISIEDGMPAGWCCAFEACMILGVGRTNLWRCEQNGLIASKKVRVRAASGRGRVISAYCRAHVRGLKKRREAERANRLRCWMQKGVRRWEYWSAARKHVQLE